jgi:hypothetical protein
MPPPSAAPDSGHVDVGANRRRASWRRGAAALVQRLDGATPTSSCRRWGAAEPASCSGGRVGDACPVISVPSQFWADAGAVRPTKAMVLGGDLLAGERLIESLAVLPAVPFGLFGHLVPQTGNLHQGLPCFYVAGLHGALISLFCSRAKLVGFGHGRAFGGSHWLNVMKTTFVPLSTRTNNVRASPGNARGTSLR